MDTYTEGAGAQNARGSSGQVLGRAAPPGYQSEKVQQATMLDQLRDQTERAASRVSSVRQRLETLGERLVGPAPESASKQVGDAISQAGFVPGTSLALDRLHGEIARIEDLLVGLEHIA